MRRNLQVLIALLLAGCGAMVPQGPPPIVVCVSSDAPQITPADLASYVAALQIQVTRDFRQFYYHRRTITLTTTHEPGAWELHVTANPVYLNGRQVDGYHQGHRAFAWAPANRGAPTGIMGHELLEMLANPTGAGHEICDAWVNHWYFINGLFVPDFGVPGGGHWCGLNKCAA